jgi:TorA maturation chaperone TorD
MSEENNTPTPFERALLWRWLAAAFTYPDAETWAWLRSERAQELLVGAASPPRFPGSGRGGDAAPTLALAQSAHLRIFGHTVRGDCPPHEIEYGSLHADKLYQPHLLADIAAFYRAFGLELTPDASERVDHIAMECEFYSVLCAKEEVAGDQIEFCHDVQKKFLREHLARWTPSFSRRVEKLSDDPFYQTAAGLLRDSVLAECVRLGTRAGSDDVQLRPAEELTDPCGACGLVNRE